MTDYVLQARDKKMRGIKVDGIINQLSKEMAYTAKMEIGYCDSDDDLDSDEEGNEDDTDREAQDEYTVEWKQYR